jgi:hypothetical protein
MTGVQGPLGIGPPNPMAMPQQAPSSVSSTLDQMAQATGSQTLKDLASRASALGQ